MNAAEALHPDLQPYVTITPVGQMLQHPFVHTLYFGSPQETEWVNAAYEQKNAAFKTALAKREWDYAIALVERPYRVDVLSRVPRDAPKYWSIVSAWWADTEFPHGRKDTWVEIFDHPEAHNLMSDSDRQVYDSLPSKVTVYRGIGEDGDEDGLSWTISQTKAEWFARRFTLGREGVVITRSISREGITAYLDRRSEQEVLILPDRW